MTIIIPNTLQLGVADSDLQVVGEQFSTELEGGSESIWAAFARKDGAIEDKSSVGLGIDRFHKWQSDSGLIKDLGIKHYRTSVSMARVLSPDGSAINRKALDWYRSYFESLREQGIAVAATLYHWELPQFVQELGGWANRKVVDYFLRHVEAVVSSLDDCISEYFILNEPWCSGWLGYAEGVHAPGIKDYKLAAAANHHLLLGQAEALRLIKAKAPEARVSTVYNLSPFYAASDKDEDRLARDYADCNVNRWYLDPLFKGEYPEPLLELFRQYMPHNYEKDLEVIKVGGLLNSFGFNYYSGGVVSWDAEAPLRFKYEEIAEAEKNGLGWTVFTPPACRPGLLDLLSHLHTEYAPYGLTSLQIAENGTAWGKAAKEESCNDDFRIRYLRQHLEQVVAAIDAGIPVHNYYLWTLIDNFEWAYGYTPKSSFGLVHIDRNTLERTPKASYAWYRNVVLSRELC
jgi:beta-glucosidase